MDLIERLLGIDVSALSDADKTLPVVDPAVRAMMADVRIAGPAFTVVAEDDHLPVMSALGEASPGDVLVIATNGGSRAVFGELVATEASRRGLAGIVADGFCRDLRGLRAIALPVFAVFFLDSWTGLAPLAGVLVLADLGLAATGVLVSSIAANSRARDLLVPLVLLPLLVPVMIAAAGAAERLLAAGGPSYDGIGKWLAILALYDVTFLLVGYAVYDFLLED